MTRTTLTCLALVAILLPVAPALAQRGTPQPNASRPSRLWVDKTDYNIGETARLFLTGPNQLVVSNGPSVFKIGRQVEQVVGSFTGACDWMALVNKPPCEFQAPIEEGTYQIRFLANANGGIAVASSNFTVSSKRAPGALRTARPTAVLGEKFVVDLTLPANRYYQASWGGPSLRLYERKPNQTWSQKETDRSWLGVVQVGDNKGAGRHQITFPAPDKPCACELRVYDRYPHENARTYLIDVIPFDIVVGNVPTALVVPKHVYRPGESIPITVDLPDNRFYEWGWYAGPTVRLMPVEIKGRKLTEEETYKGWQTCPGLCAVGVPGGGPTVNHAILPGHHELQAIIAPTVPGRYELRLYDRSHRDANVPGPIGYAFAKQEIIIEEIGASPIRLRFIHIRSDKEEPTVDVMHYELVRIEAQYEVVPGVPEPAQREYPFYYFENKVARTRNITMKSLGGGRYLSEVIRILPPDKREP